MKRCQTRYKLFYCWLSNCQPKIDLIKPDDFESLDMPDKVTAPNEQVALVVYAANLRIKRGRK